MRKYRLVLLLRSELKKEKREKLLDSVKKWAGEEVKNGKITELREKKLLYPIKKERLAEYIVYEFSSEAVAKDLDKRLLMQEDILRHLLVRMD